MRATGNSSIADPQAPPPDSSAIAAVVSSIMQRYFAIWMLMNTDQLVPLPDNQKQNLQGTAYKNQQRMFFAPYVFEISMALLCLDLVVVLLIITFRPKKILPNKPTNIATIVRMTANSRLLDDMVNGRRTVDDIKKDRQQRYGYGTYVGRDGEEHEGIELWPLVTPIIASKARNRRPWHRFAGRTAP